MQKYWAIAQKGSLNMKSDFMRENFRKFLLKYDGVRIEFVPTLPESRKQRGMFEGAYIPLWVALDGKNWKDGTILHAYREIAKQEWNGDVMIVRGKARVFGKSSKGRVALKKIMDGLLDYLVENYGIDPMLVLNPDDYKKWRDEIFPFGGPDNYISYLLSTNRLKINEKKKLYTSEFGNNTGTVHSVLSK